MNSQTPVARYKDSYDLMYWTDHIARSLQKGGKTLWAEVDGTIFSVFSIVNSYQQNEFYVGLFRGIHKSTLASVFIDRVGTAQHLCLLAPKTALFAVHEPWMPPLDTLTEDTADGCFRSSSVLYPYGIRTTRGRTILQFSRAEPEIIIPRNVYHLRLQNGNSIILQARTASEALELAGIGPQLEHNLQTQCANEDEKLQTMYSLMQEQGIGQQKYEIQLLHDFFCEIPLTNTGIGDARIESDETIAELMKLYPTLAAQLSNQGNFNDRQFSQLIKEATDAERGRLLA